MKNLLNLSIIACVIITLFSCGEREVKESTAKIRFINASLITGDINVFIDYRKVFATDIEPLNYSLFSEHISTVHQMQIKNASGVILKDTSLYMTLGARYTGVLYDSMNQLNFKIYREDFSVPNGSYCKLRFMHLSNNNPATDITKGLDSTVLFRNYSNGDISEYQLLNLDSARFNAHETGNLLPYFTQLSAQQFKAGYFYTMYLKGTLGAPGPDSTGLQVIENNSDY